jgi:hypothetical protein
VTYGAAILAATVVSVSSAAAQTAAPTAAQPADAQQAWAARAKDPSTDARFKVRVMEGVLERAVEHAATVMNQQLRTVSPDLVLLTGAARARGYRLDGYGLFFDVQVPAALRQSMGWTVRMMRQNSESVDQALTVFKRMVGGLQGKARDDAEMALRMIELQVRPTPTGTDTGFAPTVPPLFSVTPSSVQRTAQTSQTAETVQVPTVAAPPPTPGLTPPPSAAPAAPAEAPQATTTPPSSAPIAEAPPSGGGMPPMRDMSPSPEQARPVAINPLLVQNPDLAYELEVREALIGAMVEWGATLPLQAGEWLTVAARDNEDVVIPGEAADVVTIIMRVRGSDLAEFRAGRLDASGIRKRVEIREF